MPTSSKFITYYDWDGNKPMLYDGAAGGAFTGTAPSSGRMISKYLNPCLPSHFTYSISGDANTTWGNMTGGGAAWAYGASVDSVAAGTVAGSRAGTVSGGRTATGQTMPMFYMSSTGPGPRTLTMDASSVVFDYHEPVYDVLGGAWYKLSESTEYNGPDIIDVLSFTAGQPFPVVEFPLLPGVSDQIYENPIYVSIDGSFAAGYLLKLTVVEFAFKTGITPTDYVPSGDLVQVTPWHDDFYTPSASNNMHPDLPLFADAYARIEAGHHLSYVSISHQDVFDVLKIKVEMCYGGDPPAPPTVPLFWQDLVKTQESR